MFSAKRFLFDSLFKITIVPLVYLKSHCIYYNHWYRYTESFEMSITLSYFQKRIPTTIYFKVAQELVSSNY